MNEVIIIPAERLREITAGLVDENVTVQYWASSALVRSLYWRRLAYCLRLCETPAKEAALDFGCGTGVFLPSLERRFATVVGVDHSLTIARKLAGQFCGDNVVLVESDATSLPFDNDSFGAVFAVSVLEHFRRLADPLAEIARVLKPGGQLIVSSPTENLFYRFGRKVFGYQKPWDHYSSAADVRRAVGEFFALDAVRAWPLGSATGLAAFEVIRGLAPVTSRAAAFEESLMELALPVGV